MTEDTAFRSACPIASALDLVGDRWTLLIVRDIAFGGATFTGFAHSAERIPRNILTERLRRMVANGLLRRERYQERPDRFRYLLTRKGADLLPVVQALGLWSAAHLGHVYPPPEALLALGPADLTSGTPQA
jgi:DNA-binding HxlR family transcriptional regulator